MDVCTIIAKNYVAQARVLARSFAAQHPDGSIYALVIDHHDGYLRAEDEPFEIVTPGELAIERFHEMAALYDVTELCTAVKPWLLRWVLARSQDATAMYLDPDMRLYAPLDDVHARISDHKLVLSPHSMDPLPRDGKRPSEQHILMAGAYNLGFIGIGAGDFAEELLTWWSDRLETDCIVDPERGLFVDQRWIDLVPGMAPSFHVLRDRGFNVAYWNVASRPVGRSADGAWLAGEVPLRLFHFSGFDLDSPLVLSRYQDRVAVYEHPDLAELCLEYARELREAGAHDVAAWPYTYEATATGLTLTTDVRRAYRELVAAGEIEGSIFEPEGAARLLETLNAPAAPHLGGASGVTRYLASLHARHPHLQRAFPELADADGPRIVEWARTHSRGEVPEPLLPAGAQSRRPQPRPQRAAHDRAFGVNVAGYLKAELGIGEVARQAITALDAAGVPVLPLAIAAPDSREGHPYAHRGVWQGGYPINLVCVNADALPAFARDAGPGFFQRRDTIGWWWWELAEFPEQWRGSFGHVDELWAGSHFVAEALAAVSPVPVTRVPVAVSVTGPPRADRERLGLPAGFLFLFSFDYRSVLARKNPIGVIDAFLQAFPEPGEATLILKSINGDQRPDDRDRVLRAAAGQRHIVIRDEYLEPVDTDRLLASCDCYVSLHRAEGFGMTMAEAMALGKPVIATGYSGNLDYMTPDNSWLVDYRLSEVGAGADPYMPHARWADPNAEHAAALMRCVVEDREEAGRRADRAARDIRRTHSPEVAGAQMAKLLRDIATRVPAPHGDWEDSRARAHVRAADELVRAGSQPARGLRAGAARRSARRLLLRVMKPHIAHQHQVDRAVIDALEDITAEIRALTERGFAVEALSLAGLRDVERRLRELVELEVTARSGRIDDPARDDASVS